MAKQAESEKYRDIGRWERVTPDKARNLLKTVEGNRVANPVWIDKLASDMRKGLWQDNGQPIILDTEGRLLDGQHRLHALVKANMPQRLLIVRGVDRAAQTTMDRTRPRSLADMLYMKGVTTAYRDLQAAVFLLWRWRNDRLRTNRGSADYPTVPEALELYDKEQAILNSVPHGMKMRKKIGKCSAWIFAHYILSQIDALLADSFVDAVANGASLAEDDPTFVLRERLISLNVQAMRMRTRPPEAEEVVRLIFKAWNAMRAGRKIRMLKTVDGEKFPVPK